MKVTASQTKMDERRKKVADEKEKLSALIVASKKRIAQQGYGISQSYGVVELATDGDESCEFAFVRVPPEWAGFEVEVEPTGRAGGVGDA